MKHVTFSFIDYFNVGGEFVCFTRGLAGFPRRHATAGIRRLSPVKKDLSLSLMRSKWRGCWQKWHSEAGERGLGGTPTSLHVSSSRSVENNKRLWKPFRRERRIVPIRHTNEVDHHLGGVVWGDGNAQQLLPLRHGGVVNSLDVDVATRHQEVTDPGVLFCISHLRNRRVL